MVQKIRFVRIVVAMQQQTISGLEQWLISIRPDIKKVDWMFALDDMKALLHELGNPQEKYKVIHIAGTSGKTSTAYYTAAMLRETGAKVGLTVSPHVDSITERVQVNGTPLTDEQFLVLWNEFVNLDAVHAERITYFGLLVAFALWVFARLEVDYAVIEVGMGGAKDATNVISNLQKVCVITDIGLDHTQFLGDTLTAIATEKSGIIQSHQAVFAAEQGEEVMDVIAQATAHQHGQLHLIHPDMASAPAHLPGFQKRNWLVAREVVSYVMDRDNLRDLSNGEWLQTSQTVVPARMEEVSIAGKIVILDGSHNGQKIAALASAVGDKYPGKRIATVLAMVEGKDTSLPESLEALHGISEHLIVTSFTATQDVYRPALPVKAIEGAAQALHFSTVQIEKDPQQALHVALKSDAEVVLVTGSFFLLNHIRPEMSKLKGTE
jgi:dihydrofolate synthase/folylpolyglutamate synthase